MEDEHSGDGEAVLQGLVESLWHSSCLSLPFWSVMVSLMTVVQTRLACAVDSLPAIKIACEATDVFRGLRLTVVVSITKAVALLQ